MVSKKAGILTPAHQVRRRAHTARYGMTEYYHTSPVLAQGFSTANEFLENQAALEGDEQSDSTAKGRSRTAIQTGFSRGSGSFPRNGRVIDLAASNGIFRSYVEVEKRGVGKKPQ